MFVYGYTTLSLQCSMTRAPLTAHALIVLHLRRVTMRRVYMTRFTVSHSYGFHLHKLESATSG